MLIPVSYAAIVGGTVTLIGTSTNIIVDGVVRQEGMRPFTIFEIAPLGLAVAAVGLVMLTLFRGLLPKRTSMADLTAANQQAKFLVEVAVPEGSQLIGKPPLEMNTAGETDRRLIDVVRAGQSLRTDMSAVTIEAGDVLVFRTSVSDVMTMKEQGHVATALAPSTVAPIGSRAAIMVEALVGPGSGLLDKSLDELRIRRRYGVYPVAIHRRGANLAERLRTTPIQVGDTMLLEGATDDLRRLVDQEGLVSVAAPRSLGFRPDRAPIAILAMLGVIVGASFGILPIAGLAIIGAAVVLATRCVEPQEAFDSIDWRTLTLIVAMLAFGTALDKTGLVQAMVTGLSPWLSLAPPIVALALVYVIAAVLTESVTNNAVAIVVTSVVIALAAELGLDPRPFVVAVMFAASASFLTPIGYQTNTLVYGPGGYRFTDYLRLGLPLALVVGVVTVLLIPVFWPLQPAG
jgi:di/tricarboxylate transporter